MSYAVCLAIDLGASSGRHVAGSFDGQRLELAELYRFDNGPTLAAGRMYWDYLQLWTQLQNGLKVAHTNYTDQIRSVGVDTWGVDFALLGRNGEILSNPVHYRDPRTTGMLELAESIVPRAEIFAATGVQFMPINTLYQLLAMRVADSPVLAAAQTFLMMPDLFHWLLSGQLANEYTNATTTQMLNPRTRGWAVDLLQRLNIPTQMLGELIQPGTVLGTLLPAVRDSTGLGNVQVIAPGTHDTASAVLAVPVDGSASAADPANSGPGLDWCYISSGTWSLMGVEVPQPIITERSLQCNFTNEGGVGQTTRLLKNIAGLWLVQECRRIWRAAGEDHDWSELAALAAQAEPLRSLINPDDPVFLAPANMPAAIQDFCRRTNQPVPATPGQIIRTALESLALRYRQVLGWLRELTGGPIRTIHIVGGGSNNALLNQMTAAATGARVIAGPVEGTAIGNVLMQLIALGEVGSITEARQIVRRSFLVEEITAGPGLGTPAEWNGAAERFAKWK
ncbi:MAG: rhamnulokinase family protein [Pirellulales bacterium]|nr:rhamnulokinase family protein [Pirellulales bacterium]